MSDMATLYGMNKGWAELESDPGLFSLLLNDFGVPGVQVEEIYDLQKPMEGPVYGFIFLFKWIEERRARRKITQEEESFVTDETVVNSMFFAQQVIPNSCATHALVSVLLNCEHRIKLGDTLTELKHFTGGMNPSDKGNAIGNMPDLARAHNSHARPEPSQMPEKQQGISVRTAEAFHFVSYVPINGRLFELDGLKPYPIDHGPWGEHEEWTDKFYRVITERLGMATGGEPYHDIRFNLMAVVPDRQLMYEQKLKTLKTNRHIVLEALQQMVNVTAGEEGAATTTTTSSKTVGHKTEPIVTRSIAARHQVNNGGDKPVYRSTRLKQKAERAEEKAMQLQQVKEEAEDVESLHEDLLDGPDVKAKTREVISNAELKLEKVKDTDVKIHIHVSDSDKEGGVTMPTTVATTDITKPLTIQTKFAYTSPGPSSESTDTASEVGSCYNSPICSTSASGEPSPNTVTACRLRLAAGHLDDDTSFSKADLAEKLSRVKDVEAQLSGRRQPDTDHVQPAGGATTELSRGATGGATGSHDGEAVDPISGAKSKFSSSHGFTPKDLLDLLKNVEREIASCEANLIDEREKKKKYKIDDCRRTHNYDQFICTFLSMLAEQGHLADLVEQHALVKRRPSSVNNQQQSGNKTAARKVDNKRKRVRPTKKRR